MSPARRIEAVAERSRLVHQALEFARETHAGARRDVGEDVPFIEHPVAAAELLIRYGHGEELVAAALLHDTLEYGERRPSELLERFGMRVALLVNALTEDLEIEDYETRKEELRNRVAGTGEDAKRVFAADKIANVVALREEYGRLGEEIELGMLVDLDLKILSWEYDLEILFGEDQVEPLFQRLADELIELWGQRAGEWRTESS